MRLEGIYIKAFLKILLTLVVFLIVLGMLLTITSYVDFNLLKIHETFK